MSDGKLKEFDYFVQKVPGPAKENGAQNQGKITKVRDGKVPGTAGGKR